MKAKLVLLYGPPAAGKFTIAKELEKLTGFKNFHNHAIVDPINEIFGWENPARGKLEYDFRAKIVEEAAKSGINLIVTGVIVKHNEFLYKGMIDVYKNHGGQVCIVQIAADRNSLLDRVEDSSRKNKFNSKEKLDDYLNKFPESLEKFGENEQLLIDTTSMNPEVAAQKIVDHFKL